MATLSGINIGELERYSLAVIQRKPGVSVRGITEDLTEKTRRMVSAQSIYQAATRLEEKGYVKSQLKRNIRAYRISPLGKRKLAATLAELGAVVSGELPAKKTRVRKAA